MPGLNIRKGDKVKIISGKDKHQTGRVIMVLPAQEKVVVEGANRIKKHTKVTSSTRGAKQGGIVTQEAPMHVSNVQIVCGECKRPTRIGHRRDDAGRNKRICVRCKSDL